MKDFDHCTFICENFISHNQLSRRTNKPLILKDDKLINNSEISEIILKMLQVIELYEKTNHILVIHELR